jgi:hypothetical protein
MIGDGEAASGSMARLVFREDFADGGALPNGNGRRGIQRASGGCGRRFLLGERVIGPARWRTAEPA